MIVLFTDFGTRDPYVGQVKARIHELAPSQQVVDLLPEAPDFNAHAGAHLVAAFAPHFPPGTVFVCVVDPGVGTERDGVVVTAGGRWFVGPDNGLLSIAAARNPDSKVWRIAWMPEHSSATFHGARHFWRSRRSRPGAWKPACGAAESGFAPTHAGHAAR